MYECLQFGRQLRLCGELNRLSPLVNKPSFGSVRRHLFPFITKALLVWHFRGDVVKEVENGE